METKSRVRYLIITALITIGLILFDQLTKYLAVCNLKDQADIHLIDNVLHLFYLENTGAAFGLMQNNFIFFYILTFAFIAVAVYFFIRVPLKKRYLPLQICMCFLLAGAIGNLIDRIVNQYVVDFIYFICIDFPIFNVADIYLTLSIIVLVLLVIFYYKDSELTFFKPGTKTDETD